MLVVVITMTVIDPDHRSVIGIYRTASAGFARGAQIYPDAVLHGFLYLPGFAVLYAPFDLLGPRIGDSLWKMVGAGLVLYAAWSQCRVLDREARASVFSLALALAIPLVAGSIRNGQTNVHLAASCWLMILCAFRGQYIGIVVWTGIAILTKPLAIVAILLVGGVRPRTIPALAGGVAWAIALPFAVADAGYVVGLYRDGFGVFFAMATSDTFAAANFAAVFRLAGVPLASSWITLVNFAAALATFAGALWMDGRLRQEAMGLAIACLSASYMCLFNPRAEGVTYALVALPLSIVVAIHLSESRERRFWIIPAMLLLAAGSTGLVREIHIVTEYWFKPVVLAIIMAMIAVGVIRCKDPNFERWLVRSKPQINATHRQP